MKIKIDKNGLLWMARDGIGRFKPIECDSKIEKTITSKNGDISITTYSYKQCGDYCSMFMGPIKTARTGWYELKICGQELEIHEDCLIDNRE